MLKMEAGLSVDPHFYSISSLIKRMVVTLYHFLTYFYRAKVTLATTRIELEPAYVPIYIIV